MLSEKGSNVCEEGCLSCSTGARAMCLSCSTGARAMCMSCSTGARAMCMSERRVMKTTWQTELVVASDSCVALKDSHNFPVPLFSPPLTEDKNYTYPIGSCGP